MGHPYNELLAAYALSWSVSRMSGLLGSSLQYFVKGLLSQDMTRVWLHVLDKAVCCTYSRLCTVTVTH